MTVVTVAALRAALERARGAVDVDAALDAVLAALPTGADVEPGERRECHHATEVVWTVTDGVTRDGWYHPQSRTRCDDPEPVEPGRPVRKVCGHTWIVTWRAGAWRHDAGEVCQAPPPPMSPVWPGGGR